MNEGDVVTIAITNIEQTRDMLHGFGLLDYNINLVIDPGETKTVIFKDLPAPTFGSPVKVQVSVDPVPGETNRSNNSFEYPVIFSLG